MIGKGNFSKSFKRDALAQITERGYPVSEVSERLGVSPHALYAWLRNPLSKRAREAARQTALIRRAWKESGKVYGYRKLHDDLLDQSETC